MTQASQGQRRALGRTAEGIFVARGREETGRSLKCARRCYLLGLDAVRHGNMGESDPKKTPIGCIALL